MSINAEGHSTTKARGETCSRALLTVKLWTSPVSTESWTTSQITDRDREWRRRSTCWQQLKSPRKAAATKLTAAVNGGMLSAARTAFVSPTWACTHANESGCRVGAMESPVCSWTCWKWLCNWVKSGMPLVEWRSSTIRTEAHWQVIASSQLNHQNFGRRKRIAGSGGDGGRKEVACHSLLTRGQRNQRVVRIR